MSQEKFAVGEVAQIQIQCRGDLSIRSWSEATVMVRGDDYQVVEGAKTLSIEGSGDLSVMVPASVSVSVVEANGDLLVKNVEGDTHIAVAHGDVALSNLGRVEVGMIHADLAASNLSGDITIEELMGDVSLRRIGNVQINKIYGDCAVGFAEGAVYLTSVYGDISLRTVSGNVHIEEAKRDLNLRNVGGTITVDMVHGDVRLRGGLAAGKHSLTASGDIVVRWPRAEPLIVEAYAPAIRNRLNLEEVVEEQGKLSGRLGDGQTFLRLNAKRRIILKEAELTSKDWADDLDFDMAFDFDLSGIGEQISAEIGSRMSDFSQRMEDQFGPEFATRVEEKAQKAAQRAEKAAERAMRQAEKAAKKIRWQAGGYGTWKAPTPPTKPGSKQEKVSEEEQLKILRMVEKGIISPQEASDLLEAIGDS